MWPFVFANPRRQQSTPLTTKLSRLLDALGSIHSVLTLVSFTAFLVTGHYRTLLDRVLRMRLVPPSRNVARDVSFEYLNRQLVWHAFTEFLLFVLPLLRIGRWRRWWARLLRKLRSEGSGGGGGDDETVGELGFLPERTCAICYRETDAASTTGGGRATDITNPYEAVECGHVYCYVCLAGKIELEEGEGWPCLRCSAVVKRCRPWRGGVKGLTGVGDWGQELYGDRRAASAGGGDGGSGGGGGGGGVDVGPDDDDGLSLASLSSLSSSSPSLSSPPSPAVGPPSHLLDELQDGDVESELSELGDDDRHRYSDDDDDLDYQVERRHGHEERGGRRRRRRGGEEEDGPATDVEAESSDAGSEVTVQPMPTNGHSSEQWAALDYADDHVFDDSQYNTAEDYD